MSRFWAFLNTSVGVVLLGFVFTTLAGGMIAYWFAHLSWERESAFEAARQNFEWERNKRFEILRRRLDDGQESLEEISDLINLRFFRLQGVFDLVVAGNLSQAETNWTNYMETVEQWNTKLIINQNKLGRLVSEGAASEFNNYETDRADLGRPVSIHGQFFVTHQSVLELLRCLRDSECEISRESIDSANSDLRTLDIHSDEYVDEISRLFVERAYELEEFDALER